MIFGRREKMNSRPNLNCLVNEWHIQHRNCRFQDTRKGLRVPHCRVKKNIYSKDINLTVNRVVDQVCMYVLYNLIIQLSTATRVHF